MMDGSDYHHVGSTVEHYHILETALSCPGCDSGFELFIHTQEQVNRTHCRTGRLTRRMKLNF